MGWNSKVKLVIQGLLYNRIRWSEKIDKTLYLTFDDGPHPVYTQKILDILESYDIKATFFLVGKEILSHPDVVMNIVKKGHAIGNHSFKHGLDWKNRRCWLLKEISDCNDVILNVTGIKAKLFRPPWGVVSIQMIIFCIFKGMKIVNWSFDSLDCKKSKNIGITMAKSGDIILLHDDDKYCIDIIERDIPILLKKGFLFMSLK